MESKKSQTEQELADREAWIVEGAEEEEQAETKPVKETKTAPKAKAEPK